LPPRCVFLFLACSWRFTPLRLSCLTPSFSPPHPLSFSFCLSLTGTSFVCPCPLQQYQSSNFCLGWEFFDWVFLILAVWVILSFAMKSFDVPRPRNPTLLYAPFLDAFKTPSPPLSQFCHHGTFRPYFFSCPDIPLTS